MAGAGWLRHGMRSSLLRQTLQAEVLGLGTFRALPRTGERRGSPARPAQGAGRLSVCGMLLCSREHFSVPVLLSTLCTAPCKGSLGCACPLLHSIIANSYLWTPKAAVFAAWVSSWKRRKYVPAGIACIVVQ